MIDFILKRSRRTRRMTIAVRHTGEVIVTVPHFASPKIAENFVKLKSDWIKKTQARLKKRFEGKEILQQSKREFNSQKLRALGFVKERLMHYNKIYNFKIGDIRIKNHSSRWGSCSARGNLNFNYNLINLPQELADYIIVHELCHLKEFNHSKQFWDLMAVALPNWKSLRKKLRHDYISIK